MIEKLRYKMICICSSITAMILIIICVVAFYIFYEHYEAETYARLENQLSDLIRSIQQDKTVSHDYFKELQERYQLLIHIEDNGTPLLFSSNLETIQTQEDLFAKAKTLATDTYNFNLNPVYINSVQLPVIHFKFHGTNDKHYLAMLSVFPTDHGHCQVIFLQDLVLVDAYIFQIKLLFIGLVLGGTLLLILFSFFFVGMAMKPIVLSKQKQAEFIAAASHELRAPLTVIEAGMSSLNYINDPRSAHFIELMQSECIRMKRLINDLLTLARSDAHQWQMKFDAFEIDGLLIELYDSYYEIAHEKGLILTLHLPDTLLPAVYGDAGRIKQALTILLDNAISYVPRGETITLGVVPTPKHLVLSVMDTGIGIYDEDKRHIFQRFYQGDRSRHEKNHYGLGLSIAYEIILLHHSKLTLTDTLGGGCTFTFTLGFASSSK